MFYDSAARQAGDPDPGLPWNPFKALVAPRPIGWISTVSSDGVVNVAPYSYFQAVSDDPDVVMFSAGPRMYAKDGALHFSDSEHKHSQLNAEATGEFVCNLATWDLREDVNATSAHVDHSTSEAVLADLDLVPSARVSPPRLASSPAALECSVIETCAVRGRLGGTSRFTMVFGEVVGIFVQDPFVSEGRVNTAAMRPIARMGYDEYAIVEEAFRMGRPADDPVYSALREEVEDD